MRLKNLENMTRLIKWAEKHYRQDWVSEILNRCCDDVYPPYEFWTSIHHLHCINIERMVARGIACWLEQQEEPLQDFILALLDDDDIMHEEAEYFGNVCRSIWAFMMPAAWLERHAVDTRPTSTIWRSAVYTVFLAIRHDEWKHLRNYKAEFFLEESDHGNHGTV
jgi:hypothetical protein